MDALSLLILFAVWLMLVVILGGVASKAHEQGQFWRFVIDFWKDTPWRWRLGMPLLLVSIPVYLAFRIIT